ncbi:MAG: hypothetical protein ABSF38_10145 [Verrucomicrobiota bacterium]|jgi:hypothetical protein
MNNPKSPLHRIKIGLGIAALAALTGCVGYVGGGYGGTVIVPGPDVSFWGGGVYERGPDVHAFSQRGVASRAVAHPGGGGGGGARRR